MPSGRDRAGTDTLFCVSLHFGDGVRERPHTARAPGLKSPDECTCDPSGALTAPLGFRARVT